MSNNNLIDLSLVKNQNELAIKIADFFTKDEFRIIDLSQLHRSGNRNINEIEYIYYYNRFDENKELKIIDMLLLDIYPATRYIIIRFILENTIDSTSICFNQIINIIIITYFIICIYI